MSLRIASKDKPVGNFLTSLIEAYPDASMRDIAVLFTDVVGSTNFFKVHGDLRGREMLRTHHNMAMSIVDEYGGSLIKEVGDSVMVYFPEPKEALKAAIMMQHKFFLYNQENGSNDEIHVRIGLHHGKVIVEEKDIYGDVVNVAAKLTNLAEGDQIFVSHEIYDLTKDAAPVNFEHINFWNMKNVPTGLTIYKVDWEKTPVAPPARNVLVVIAPYTADTGNSIVAETMALFDNEKDDLLDGQYISSRKTGSGAPVFIYEKPSAALEASEKIFAFLTERSGIKDTPLPVKIFITGATLKIEREILSSGPGAELSTVPYGGIYLTGEIFQEIQNHCSVTGSPLPNAETLGPLFRILRYGLSEKETGEYLTPPSTAPSAKGLFSPCFYCGSVKHRVMDCPSKTLTESGKSINRLGYLTMQKIEEIALSIGRSSANIEGDIDPFSASTASIDGELAAYAYYDLKTLYQFRFSHIVWNSKADSWNKIGLGLAENQGGFVWLAQDSLRVSNYEKAKSFLKLALERSPNDYKVYCVSGFLDIEEDNFPGAITNFSKALEAALTKPQKIYSSMILARLYKLSGDRQKAHEILSSILRIDASCKDAIYQDIIFSFEQNTDEPALKRLAILTRENKEYFVISLIDPELASHRNNIYAHLSELLTGAKEDALLNFNETRKVFADSRPLLPPSILKNVEPLLINIEELLRSDSYFAYLDIPHQCSGIKTMCKNAMREQVNDILGIIRELRSRIDKAQSFVRSYRYPHLTEKYVNKLLRLRTSLDYISDVRSFDSSEQFKNCYQACNDIADQLSGLEGKLEMLDLVRQLIYLCLRFLKNSSIFFSIIFFLGIFIFPLISDQINALLGKLDISAFPNAWAFQKTFLIFGGIVSIIVSFIITIKELFKNEAG